MKKIVEAYGSIGALNSEDLEIIPVKFNDNMTRKLLIHNKHEILLSDVKEGSIICRLQEKRRLISTYTNNTSVTVTNVYIYTNNTNMRTTINHILSCEDTTLYVAKNYREAFEWLVKEE